MRPHHPTLNREQVHRSATRRLQNSVPMCDDKRKVSAQTLWAVLLVAALPGAWRGPRPGRCRPIRASQGGESWHQSSPGPMDILPKITTDRRN
jgi:hypothetical protein